MARFAPSRFKVHGLLGAEGFEFVEGGEAESGGLGVGLVGEGREDVGVLVAGQAIGIGDHGVNGGTHGPAGVVALSV